MSTAEPPTDRGIEAETEAAVAAAAQTLQHARRHAVWLERLAVSILAFGIVFAALGAVIEPPLVWACASLGLAAGAAWGLLRGLALLLHLRVDAIMLGLDDELEPSD